MKEAAEEWHSKKTFPNVDSDEVLTITISYIFCSRKIIQEGRQKLLPVKFTTDIYTIRSIVAEEEFIKKRYIVEKNGEDVITEYKKAYKPQRIQLFFASELQKVDKDSKELITTEDAEKLNKIEYTTQDKKKVSTVEEKKVIQTRSKTREQKEKVEQPVEVKVHQTRSRAKTSPESKPIEDSPETKPPEKKVRPKPKPLDAPPPAHRFNLRERKNVSYVV